MEKGLLSLKEVCEYTGWGKTKAREVLKRKDSTFTVRLGTKLYVNRKLFDDYLERCARYHIAVWRNNLYASCGHKDILSQRGGDKDDVLSEKWADSLCRDHAHGFNRDSPDSRDYDHSQQCGSIKVNLYCYVVFGGIASCF